MEEENDQDDSTNEVNICQLFVLIITNKYVCIFYFKNCSKKKRKVRNEWAIEFQWIEINSLEVKCKVCNCNLKIYSGRLDLLRHSSTKKHLDAQKNPRQPTISSILTNSKAKSKESEIKLSIFLAEHNIFFCPWTTYPNY